MIRVIPGADLLIGINTSKLIRKNDLANFSRIIFQVRFDASVYLVL